MQEGFFCLVKREEKEDNVADLTAAGEMMVKRLSLIVVIHLPTKQGGPPIYIRLYFCATFAWFLGKFCLLENCFFSTPRQMPQTITNIPGCLPQILTVPKFWYHLAHSFSCKNVPLTLRGLFERLRGRPLKAQRAILLRK